MDGYNSCTLYVNETSMSSYAHCITSNVLFHGNNKHSLHSGVVEIGDKHTIGTVLYHSVYEYSKRTSE